eukprot:gene2033-biopygen2192
MKHVRRLGSLPAWACRSHNHRVGDSYVAFARSACTEGGLATNAPSVQLPKIQNLNGGRVQDSQSVVSWRLWLPLIAGTFGVGLWLWACGAVFVYGGSDRAFRLLAIFYYRKAWGRAPSASCRSSKHLNWQPAAARCRFVRNYS